MTVPLQGIDPRFEYHKVQTNLWFENPGGPIIFCDGSLMVRTLPCHYQQNGGNPGSNTNKVKPFGLKVPAIASIFNIKHIENREFSGINLKISVN